MHFFLRKTACHDRQAIAAQPGVVGIGLDEDRGVIIEKGCRLKAIGSSSVVIVDSSETQCNNISGIKAGMPISFSNLKVHIMANSDMFNIDTYEFIGARARVQKAER